MLSIIIPTYNSEEHINKCLKSIKSQTIKFKKEILIIDGGSSDKTLKISKKFKVKVFNNILKTGEAAKLIGLKKSKFSNVLFLDSDNVIDNRNWIKENINILNENKDVVAIEPYKFKYLKSDNSINRYCSMIGANDPINIFLGNYDKKSLLTKKFTDLKIDYLSKKNFFKIKLNEISCKMTFGANGTFYKKKYLNFFNKKDMYFFDVDILDKILKKNKKTLYIGKYKGSIIHNFCRNYIEFYKKQKRRIVDYSNFRKKRGIIINKLGILKFIISCLLIIPIILQSFKIYFKTKDLAAFNHIMLVYMTLIIYSTFAVIKFTKS